LGDRALSLAIAGGGILVIGLLLVDASTSAYVSSAVKAARIPGHVSLVENAGGLLAILIVGWAAAGTVIEGRRPRRSPGLALFAGIAAVSILGGLALFAIDLTHNPF
jgi:hypothetical protein